MFETLADTLLPPLLDRAVLALNHVLRTQPVATGRLAAHAGRTVDIVWRAPETAWPLPPALRLLVTPAGLLERVEPAAQQVSLTPASLVVRVDLPAPHTLVAMSLAGKRPKVDVEGDAQFAADVAWLADNVRWDAEHDLARLVGNGPAHWLAQVSRAAVTPLRKLAQGIATAATTWEHRRGAGAASPQ